MTERLGDESVEVWREAVVALLRIADPGVRPALEMALADPDREVRMYSAEALKRIAGRRP